ncbi:transposase [Mesorhizobium cantuariense]|uniref:Transposase n=1 Tax=Mesorhizobium cantuariense TaxID=1300275 RepID=A0ABV7MFY0_9HYPH
MPTPRSRSSHQGSRRAHHGLASAEPDEQTTRDDSRVGPIIATAIIAAVADPKHFKSGRQFAAWLGLVPRQHSSGGKDRLGSISKRGNPYLRRLLIIRNRSSLRWARSRPTGTSAWLTQLLERKPTNVVATAMANKTARIAWAIMVRKENFVPAAARTVA